MNLLPVFEFVRSCILPRRQTGHGSSLVANSPGASGLGLGMTAIMPPSEADVPPAVLALFRMGGRDFAVPVPTVVGFQPCGDDPFFSS